MSKTNSHISTVKRNQLLVWSFWVVLGSLHTLWLSQNPWQHVCCTTARVYSWVFQLDGSDLLDSSYSNKLQTRKEERQAFTDLTRISLWPQVWSNLCLISKVFPVNPRLFCLSQNQNGKRRILINNRWQNSQQSVKLCIFGHTQNAHRFSFCFIL